MKPVHQTLEDILDNLSALEVDWKDDRATAVIAILEGFPKKPAYDGSDIAPILLADFDSGIEFVRLFLDLPRDEFNQRLRAAIGDKPIGVTQFKADSSGFLSALESLGLYTAVASYTNAPVTWQSVLVERLKSGRGSAIRGQRRGRLLEDFTEEILKDVFGDGAFDLRCRFVGATGLSTEKTDFAIPSKDAPRILIEVKAYGSTGSKQTDILGDITRMAAEKRPDTALILVTDGVAWEARKSDLRKLIEMQNHGQITRLYTTKMASILEADMRTLKAENGL